MTADTSDRDYTVPVSDDQPPKPLLTPELFELIERDIKDGGPEGVRRTLINAGIVDENGEWSEKYLSGFEETPAPHYAPARCAHGIHINDCNVCGRRLEQFFRPQAFQTTE